MLMLLSSKLLKFWKLKINQKEEKGKILKVKSKKGKELSNEEKEEIKIRKKKLKKWSLQSVEKQVYDFIWCFLRINIKSF